MEAPKSAGAGYKRESSLYQEVRERLEQGTLTPAPRQVRVGRRPESRHVSSVSE